MSKKWLLVPVLIVLLAIAIIASAFAQEPTPEMLTDDTPGCPVLKEPYIDPTLAGSVEVNIKYFESDAVFCSGNNTTEAVAFSKAAGDGGDIFEVSFHWTLDDQFGNFVYGQDHSFNYTPESDGPATDRFSYKVPWDGQQYTLCVRGKLSQPSTGISTLEQSQCWTFQSGMGYALFQKESTKGEPMGATLLVDEWTGATWIPHFEGDFVNGNLLVPKIKEGDRYRWKETNFPSWSYPVKNGTGEFQITRDKPVFEATIVNFEPYWVYAPLVSNGEGCGVNVTYTPSQSNVERTEFYPYLLGGNADTSATIFTRYGTRILFSNVCPIIDSHIAKEGETYRPIGPKSSFEFTIPGTKSWDWNGQTITMVFEYGYRFLYEVYEDLDYRRTIAVRADP